MHLTGVYVNHAKMGNWLFVSQATCLDMVVLEITYLRHSSRYLIITRISVVNFSCKPKPNILLSRSRKDIFLFARRQKLLTKVVGYFCYYVPYC